MNNKSQKIKNELSIKKNNDTYIFIEKKIDFFKEIIQKTLLNVGKNKNMNIINIGDLNNCFEKVQVLNKKIDDITNLKNNSTDIIINNLQLINNELSIIIKNYGTLNLEDLLIICFGSNYKLSLNEEEELKLDLLKKYFHPTSYKVYINKDNISKKKGLKDENNDIENLNENIKCYDISSSYKEFKMKVNGMKINIKSNILKKTLIIFGILDDIVVDLINNKYIKDKKNDLHKFLLNNNEYENELIDRFMSSLSLNDYLINDDVSNLYKKLIGINMQVNLLKQKQIIQIVKDFINEEIYTKRNILINLLINGLTLDNEYLAYLLYDVLSNDNNGNIDTNEQILLFDSFPMHIKQLFKNAMKKTIQYTNNLSNYDFNKIPLEQQICLLKTNELVKEKAMLKLKEIKAKTEDGGTKARQYLDGLLKIPFGIYKKEPILTLMDEIKKDFNELLNKYNNNIKELNIIKKEKYTSVEIKKYLKSIENKNKYIKDELEYIKEIKKYLITGNKKKLLINIKILEEIFDNYNIKVKKYSSLTKEDLILYIINLYDTYIINLIPEKENKKIEDYDNKNLKNNILNRFSDLINYKNEEKIINNDLNTDIDNINKKFKDINNYLVDIKLNLDNAIYGHEKAKKQIERIIGQWINGEQDGYCFGFEGFPGIGKTSLAKKGLSNCLKDDKGNSRPFAMIQMGGECNGSTLQGHNYTYVGSTWGSIVQILIDKKCMNPIIFIDEVDKISKTEQGREIIGILTHLLDSAQNDCFQDKYFMGIDLDLSKALFILSYNDVDVIDKVLLDRIHRIRFDNLSLEDKIIISKTHILPEVYKKMGLDNTIIINDETIKYIIEEYTNESGVRKLKEILFEIIGEINIEILKSLNDYYIPIEIGINDIKNKYFKDKNIIKHKKIFDEDLVGLINGLWANSLGKGGIIPIQVSWRPQKEFLNLELTGTQGDVMKESMNVALTLAWQLTNDNQKKLIINKYSRDIISGIHIHCPDTNTPKNGPSAGTAITCAIYSLLNEIKIRKELAITGEICLNGNVLEIGGLELKILGAIKAGVREIILPYENKKDYDIFIEKYKNSSKIKDIKFYLVNNINEVLNIVFIK